MQLNRRFILFLIFAINLIFSGTVRGTNENTLENSKAGILFDGWVRDEWKNAIDGAEVIVPEKNTTVKTGKDGHFSMELPSEGSVHVEVYKNGFIPAITKAFSARFGMTLRSLQIVLQKSFLEEIVVTGTITPKLYWETPVKTSIASQKNIERAEANSLADSLEIMTGVRVENNCQNCGITQARICGMEGKYSQILIDGRPVVSSLANVYALEQIPANMIEKLEVIKGGGSALYGGNAVAGVINIITREQRESGTQLSLSQESIHGAPDTDLSFNSDYHSKNNQTYATIFSHFQNRQAMDYNNDGFSDLGELKNRSTGINLTRNFESIGGKLRLGFTSIYEDRRGGNKLDLPEYYADIAESARTYRTDGTIGWEQEVGKGNILRFDGSFSLTQQKSYAGANQDPNAYGETTNPAWSGMLTYNKRSWRFHNILLGVNFQSDRIDDSAPAYGRAIDVTYTDLGFFIQDEFELFRNTATLLLGARSDRHSEIGSLIFSPRASLLFKGIRNLSLRATVSTGFRAPQVFDEDLHVSLIGGEGMLIVNRENLCEERSTSFTCGLDYGKQWQNKLLQFSVSGFHNHLNNAFTLQKLETPGNSLIFERFNSEGIGVYGVEVEAGFKWGDRFEIFSGWTLQRSRLEIPEPDFGSRELFRSPNIYGSIRIDWNNPRFLDIRTELQYTGSMKVPHFAGYIEEDRLEESCPFMVWNESLSRKINMGEQASVTFFVSVHNLLDQFQDDRDWGVLRDSEYVYGPRFPRTFRFGMKCDF